MEFLRYPQLIRHLFNGGRFGPPWSFTSTSTWPWVGHSVSGPMHATYVALFRLAFAAAPVLNTLTSLHTFARRTVLQKVPDHTLTCSRCLYLSLPSRGAFHLSFTVLYAIGHWVVFRLGGWSPRLPTRFHVSGRTLDPALLSKLSLTWLSHSLACFPTHFS